MKKHYQFFTSFEDWCPIDHFFFGQYDWDGERGAGASGLKKTDPVVHLETRANISKTSGFSVSISHGKGKKKVFEDYDDIPAALRRMADLIEDFQKKHPKAHP